MLRVTTLGKPTCLSPLDQNIAGNESVNAMTNHTTSQCDFCVRSVRINIEICGGGGGAVLAGAPSLSRIRARADF